MASVARTIILNPIEPANFSLRVASGLQTSINVALFDAGGNILKQDLALQMQLTSRTKGTIKSYAMPSTDVVNGKAVAVIPKDDLTDINGYNVNLYGTIQGGAALIATGVLRLVGGPGVDQQPDDVIDDIPLSITAGAPLTLTVRLWYDTAKTIPYDLGITPVSGQIYHNPTDPVPIMTMAQTILGINEVSLALTGAQTITLPTQCWWDLRATSSSGMTTLAQGTVTVAGGVGL